MYNRKQKPCVTRPARPARCRAVAYGRWREKSHFRNRLDLLCGNAHRLIEARMEGKREGYRDTVSKPLSMTHVILSIVKPVSANPVANTTFRNPRGVVWKTLRCSLAGRLACLA